MYKNERGTTVKTSGTPIVTTAKVGLMYVSDYGYSVKNSSCNHSSISLGSYNKTACGGSAWVLKNGDEWTVSPNYSSASSVFGVNVDANVFSNSGADRGFGARPVLYLKPNVYITGGDGSINNPFQVGL
ncbi:unknown [Clostridium sp. CAG:762]|nr:unknown [Clostridium sp. CAG:762]